MSCPAVLLSVPNVIVKAWLTSTTVVFTKQAHKFCSGVEITNGCGNLPLCTWVSRHSLPELTQVTHRSRPLTKANRSGHVGHSFGSIRLFILSVLTSFTCSGWNRQFKINNKTKFKNNFYTGTNIYTLTLLLNHAKTKLVHNMLKLYRDTKSYSYILCSINFKNSHTGTSLHAQLRI